MEVRLLLKPAWQTNFVVAFLQMSKKTKSHEVQISHAELNSLPSPSLPLQ